MNGWCMVTEEWARKAHNLADAARNVRAMFIYHPGQNADGCLSELTRRIDDFDQIIVSGCPVHGLWNPMYHWLGADAEIDI